MEQYQDCFAKTFAKTARNTYVGKALCRSIQQNFVKTMTTPQIHVLALCHYGDLLCLEYCRSFDSPMMIVPRVNIFCIIIIVKYRSRHDQNTS